MGYPAILECKPHGMIGCKTCAPPITRAAVEERIRYTSEVPGASASIMADVDALVAAAVAAERERCAGIADVMAAKFPLPTHGPNADRSYYGDAGNYRLGRLDALRWMAEEIRSGAKNAGDGP